MARKAAYGGLAALVMLAVAAIGGVVLLVALIVPGSNDPEIPVLVNDQTPLVRIEDKVITRFQMDVASAHHLRRRPKEGFPYHGILLDWMYLAAEESILQRYGKGITPDDVKQERERQERSSKDKESLKKIIDFLDRYPGMYEAIMVRPVLANNAIRKLHRSRAVQGETWDKAEAALKEALRDPDFFRRMQETQPDTYVRVDTRTVMPGPGDLDHPPDLVEQERKRKKEFADKEFATVAPGEVRPELFDEDGALSIIRMVERTPQHVVYEAVSYRKSLYDIWFEGELKKLKAEILDERARRELKDNLKDNVFHRWLFGN